MTRSLRPPELERSQPSDEFDPIVEGERYRLSRAVSLAVWERACGDGTSEGRIDDARARRRFHELATRVARRGGKFSPDVGRLTGVQVAFAGTSPDAWLDAWLGEPALVTLGQTTRVTAESRSALDPRPGFDDYRVLGLQGFLQWLGPDHPLRTALIATAATADRAIAGRATRWREPLPDVATAHGPPLWHAAERHAATLYRRAMRDGVVDEHDPAVESALQQRGAGQPLPTELRHDMEDALGVSLAGVRIHTDAIAARAAQALSAEAFTVGQDIFFSEGAFAPNTRSGRKLLGHELTHVAQALRGGASPPGGERRVSQPGEPSEREADAVAERIDDAAARPVAAPRVAARPAPATMPGASASLLFRAPQPAQSGTPLQVDAATFEGAAKGMADILQSNGFTEPGRIIIVNGANVRVFDQTGKPVGSGKAYRLKTSALLPPGVFRMAGKSSTLRLIKIDDTGRAFLGGTLPVTIDFGKDLDDQDGFNQDTTGGVQYYVSPAVMLPQVDPANPPQPPPPDKPEFMKFAGTGKANAPAWPSVVLALTPQVTSVQSTGSFLCRIEKNQGVNTLDRVTNLMQPTNFLWEVLKLDSKLHVQASRQATRWQAAVDGFDRRAREVKQDRDVWAGDHPERQAIPERAIRGAMADAVTQQRMALAMVGQVAVTIMHALVEGSQLSTEDYIDVPFKDPGDYFVRCLATPVSDENAKVRRASSVAGVLVTVADVKELASSALGTPEEIKDDLDKDAESLQARRTELQGQLDAGQGNAEELRARIKLIDLKIAYDQSAAKTPGDPRATHQAKLAWARAQIAYLTGKDAPQSAAGRRWVAERLTEARKLQGEMQGILDRADARLGSNVTRSAEMPAVMVNEQTGEQSQLVFSIGERIDEKANQLELVIADITADRGRVFRATADGHDDKARGEAWNGAMRSLRRNLGRGRGWLAYRVPARYAALPLELANPVQLQMAELDQMKEMVDDTVHALTLVAILGAPFTGGASMGILAVVAPISAGSSLYNLVNRAYYDDLTLDAEAVMDMINVASLGVGHLGDVGRTGGRALRLVAAADKIAVGLLAAGQYVVMTYEAYKQLNAIDPNMDPREARRAKLRLLLSMLEQASIPVAHHMFRAALGEGPGAATKPQSTSPGTKGQLERALGSLQGKVALEIEPGLGNGVEVRYGKDADTGLVKEVTVVCGESASPRDVELHVPTARAIRAWSGFSGRLRMLWGQLQRWLLRNTRTGEPLPKTTAFEVKLELEKLQRITRDRVERLRTTKDPSERSAIELELYALEQQAREHAARLDAMDADPARGSVAMKNTKKGGKEPLPPDWEAKLEELRKQLDDPGREAYKRLADELPDPEELYAAMRGRGWDPADPAATAKKMAAAGKRAPRAPEPAASGTRIPDAKKYLDDVDFVKNTPGAQRAIARGSVEDLRAAIAVELAAKALGDQFPAAQGYEIHRELQVVSKREKPGRPGEFYRNAAEYMADNAGKTAAVGFEWDGAFWRRDGDIDLAVVKKGASGKYEFAHVNEVKSGANDRGPSALTRLKEIMDGAKHAGDGRTRLTGPGAPVDLSSAYDVSTLDPKNASAHGPRGQGFASPLELSAADLTELASSVMGDHTGSVPKPEGKP